MSVPIDILRALYRMAFFGFERLGVHVTPRHYLFPIPDTRTLKPSLWEGTSELPGLDLREADQLAMLAALVREYGVELAALQSAGGLGARNRRFEVVDAEILYGMIRRRKPRRFVEAGSGFSTLLAVQAAELNAREGHPCSIEVFDPFPRPAVRARHGNGIQLEAKPVQEAPLEVFTSLKPGDILFIDSTHILEVGSDVRYLLSEVVPRLAVGVMVHVHDVFLPHEYPRYWVTHYLRFWNEQYALQAFLAFNDHFRVAWGSALMARRHPEALMKAFPGFKGNYHEPASFWFERVAPGTA